MNNDWLDIDVLEDYLDGKLDAKAMHFVEKHALDDPFVAEAIEGLRQSPKRKQTLSILQKKLYDRVAQKPIKRKMWGITTQRLSIAATATMAFIVVSILFFMREMNRKNAETAQRKANGVIVNLDTNTNLATAKPQLKVSQTYVDSISKTAVIEKALKEAKTNNLAVVRQKQAPNVIVATEIEKSKNVNKDVVAQAPVVAYAKGSAGTVYKGAVISEDKTTIEDANSKGKVIGNISTESDVDINRDKSLNEIAVINDSKNSKKEAVLKSADNLAKKSIEVAKPIPNPNVNYEVYLTKNNKLYNPKGPIQIVVISFKVNNEGKPTDFKILKSLNKDADAEAIRLVKDGPNWVLPKAGTDTVILDVKF